MKTKKSKIVGYIITENDGGVFAISPMDPENAGGIWRSDDATLFPTRRAAKRAIPISLAYSKSQGYGWHEWLSEAKIYAVRA